MEANKSTCPQSTSNLVGDIVSCIYSTLDELPLKKIVGVETSRLEGVAKQ